MSATDDWMPLKLQIWRSGTALMMPEARGPYLDLILTYWELGPLPKDDAILQSNARVADAKLWRRIRGQIIAKFYERDGTLCHERCDIERQLAKQIFDRKSSAGKAGGQASAQARAKQKPTAASIVLEANDLANGNTKDQGPSTANQEPEGFVDRLALSEVLSKVTGHLGGGVPWSREQKKAAWQSKICNEAQRMMPAEKYVDFLDKWANDDPAAKRLAEKIDKRLRMGTSSENTEMVPA